MQTYDFAQTVELLELVRDTPIFIPVLLTVFCGLRRGEIRALRWREVDLVAGQVSVARSLEQTKGGKSKGLRFKSPKSGKGRTVALPSTVIEELQAYRAKRAQEFLRLGKGLSDDDLVTAHEDGSIMAPIYISQRWDRFIREANLPRTDSVTCDTPYLYSHVIPGMQEDLRQWSMLR